MTTHLGFPLETVAVFVVLSVGAIAIDLFAHRSDKPMSLKSAALWSVFWIAVSLAFGGYLWFHHGSETASLFFTGYALEKVLSVDNLFVIMAVFSWFKIPEAYRHRVLYWGIIGAIVFRMVFVAIGTGLMALGPYVELVFAVVVGWTGVMMLRRDEEDEANEDYSEHLAYRWVHRFFPVWPRLHGHNFFLRGHELPEACRQNPDVRLEPAGEDLKHPEQHHPQLVKKGALVATPLFLCLAIIEISDVMFAFDSVPAVIAVSKEPLIVYSAMMFAILGLRTMYFVLEALRGYLVHLEKAVVALLFFIAVKLALSASEHLFQHGYEISPNASLVVVLVMLALGVAASFVFPEKNKAEEQNKQP
ncbi:tellurium resistance protein TerC [Eikenella corrodens]|uniref:TerC/Alx family metal homeostasis membrane protein n=1 Tax=Eikenella corrodens TaxID=539 RepID=UPI0007D0B3C6|nr:TerC/Alx family metal homeostasis membrane protein [Eikenella corrodens]MDU4301370.1 TerC/Alx family metal homeostasis membrane protein [Eikenella corrodens]OAM25236.1 tellurium resistance protein TerC [Eikenella corrodens]OWP27695.1 tellurium resistance protein TerC [Eikenella corrodens]